jgi:hypothetical protein
MGVGHGLVHQGWCKLGPRPTIAFYAGWRAEFLRKIKPPKPRRRGGALRELGAGWIARSDDPVAAFQLWVEVKLKLM